MQKQVKQKLCRLKINIKRKLIATSLFILVFFHNSFAENLLTKKRTSIPGKISLLDSIYLAIRNNPNVEISELNHVLQKFNLETEEWQFKPHYEFKTSATWGRSRSADNPFIIQKGFNVQPTVSWLSPIGTKVDLLASNQETDHYNPGLSLQIMQPLLQGFGKPIVEAALNNAKDSLVISKLNIESVMRTTVTDVINAYLELLNAENAIQIDQNALARAQKSVEQTQYYIKAGHMAGNEIITAQADVANAKTLLENDKNRLWEARYALLNAIGLDPNSIKEFQTLDINALIKKYQIPALDEVKQLILNNDIQYQIDEITLHGSTSRSLMIAEDQIRPRLDLEANINTGNGVGGGKNAGIDSLFNGANEGQSIGLTLQIPLDNQTAKQAIVGAKIALREAEIALKKEKWQKETGAINAWHLVVSSENSLRYAIDAESLQEKTYNISYQKYLHGLIDSLELQAAQQQLMQAQQQLLTARISYLKALVNLDFLMGRTLKTWNIHLRQL